MKKATWAQGRKRLLKLADYLMTADEQHLRKGERTYKQSAWVHPCGAPACAFGHYAAMPMNRRRFVLSPPPFQSDGVGQITRRNGDDVDPFWNDGFAAREFGVTSDEADKLFAHNGCGGAKTAQMAAEYIREFVARKDKAQKRKRT